MADLVRPDAEGRQVPAGVVRDSSFLWVICGMREGPVQLQQDLKKESIVIWPDQKLLKLKLLLF